MVCVTVSVMLGVLFAHHTKADWFDAAVGDRLHASIGAHVTALNFVVSVGDPVPVAVMTLLLVLGCLVARRWRGAILPAVAVPAASALTEIILKPLIDRTRLGGLSFPSGHTTGITALAVCIVLLIIAPSRPGPAGRAFLGLAAGLTAAAVAVALVALGLHYCTDTVGAAAVSTAVVLATALILDRIVARPADVVSPSGHGARLTSGT